MRITLMSAYFPPEIGAASHLFYELGSQFVRNGHDVTVLTSYPTYNVDQQKLPPRYRRGLKMVEHLNGMRVIRIRTLGVRQTNPILRGVGQIVMACSLLLLGITSTKRHSGVILVYSPPLFIGFVALVMRLFTASKVVVNVQDLFPQSAIDLGILRQPLLISIFQWFESYIYRHADLITVHSEGNRDHVLRCGSKIGGTAIVPNYVDIDQIRPGERDNEFRAALGLRHDAFVVSFAGVLGYSQDLDTVVETAKLLTSNPQIVFYIVGDGVEKERLTQKANGLSNVTFLPMLSRDKYVELLHASDLCLVTLRKEVRTPVVPSKILSIMAAGRPLIASLPLDGDAPRIVDESQGGICVPPGNPKEFAKAIERLFNNRPSSEQMGKYGRKYVEEHFSLASCTKIYERLFTNNEPSHNTTMER